MELRHPSRGESAAPVYVGCCTLFALWIFLYALPEVTSEQVPMHGSCAVLRCVHDEYTLSGMPYRDLALLAGIASFCTLLTKEPTECYSGAPFLKKAHTGNTVGDGGHRIFTPSTSLLPQTMTRTYHQLNSATHAVASLRPARLLKAVTRLQLWAIAHALPRSICIVTC